MEFDKKYFAKRLRELRRAKGLTQEQVASKIGVDPSNYNHIERGRSTPLITTLYRILKALDVSFNEVFDYSHFEEEKLIDSKNLEIYNNFSIKKKRLVHKILRALEDLD